LLTDLLQKLAVKELSRAEITQYVESDFELLPILFEGLACSKAAVRYGCGALLMDLSAKCPSKLYPYMDNFVSLLDSKYRILTWNALGTIANLTAADQELKFDAIFDLYYSFLRSEYMVTVANVVVFSEKILQNKPYLADWIALELLKVKNLKITPHLTNECKLVIAEKAIQTFNTLIRYTKNKSALIKFVEKYQNSTRSNLNKTAQTFLKNIKDK
jgi:hypothetical protein